jgi:hypothetical protein
VIVRLCATAASHEAFIAWPAQRCAARNLRTGELVSPVGVGAEPNVSELEPPLDEPCRADAIAERAASALRVAVSRRREPEQHVS